MMTLIGLVCTDKSSFSNVQFLNDCHNATALNDCHNVIYGIMFLYMAC